MTTYLVPTGSMYRLRRGVPEDLQPFFFTKTGAQRTDFNEVLKRVNRPASHGFKSTFRDWATETTSTPGEVVEMALAHTIGSKAEATYGFAAAIGLLFGGVWLVQSAWPDLV